MTESHDSEILIVFAQTFAMYSVKVQQKTLQARVQIPLSTHTGTQVEWDYHKNHTA